MPRKFQAASFLKLSDCNFRKHDSYLVGGLLERDKGTGEVKNCLFFGEVCNGCSHTQKTVQIHTALST